VSDVRDAHVRELAGERRLAGVGFAFRLEAAAVARGGFAAAAAPLDSVAWFALLVWRLRIQTDAIRPSPSLAVQRLGVGQLLHTSLRGISPYVAVGAIVFSSSSGRLFVGRVRPPLKPEAPASPPGRVRERVAQGVRIPNVQVAVR
jgi:hypothetical protein